MGVGPFFPLSRFSRSIGSCGRKTETILFITQLHAPTSHRHPSAALKRDVPTGMARCVLIESSFVAFLGADAPARERAGKPVGAMPGDKQTGRARRLRRKTETTGEERRLDLDLAEAGGGCTAFQAFFQSPSRIARGSRLDDEEEGRVETEGKEACPIRTPPFARGMCREAP